MIKRMIVVSFICLIVVMVVFVVSEFGDKCEVDMKKIGGVIGQFVGIVKGDKFYDVVVVKIVFIIINMMIKEFLMFFLVDKLDFDGVVSLKIWENMVGFKGYVMEFVFVIDKLFVVLLVDQKVVGVVLGQIGKVCLVCYEEFCLKK